MPGADHIVAETVEAIVHKPALIKKTGSRFAHPAGGSRVFGLRPASCHPRPVRFQIPGGWLEAGAAAHFVGPAREGRRSRFIKVVGQRGGSHHAVSSARRRISIGDALVVLANKRDLIEGQGNYGNIFTGDPAAAPRYIECGLMGTVARNGSLQRFHHGFYFEIRRA